MKRLFMLRHNKGGSAVLGDNKHPIYFQTKQKAKAARDKRGGSTVVSVGVDHKLYKGV